MKKIKDLHILSILAALLSFTLSFVGGVFAKETAMEKNAEYATEVVKSHTEQKKYCAITVEKTSQSGGLIDPYNEFCTLYGAFKQTKVTFASAMNTDKRHNIRIHDNQGNAVSDNLSAQYVGPVGTIEYNGHYKHYAYPLEMMFEDESLYDISRYIAYISQEHADNLLKSRGVELKQGSYLESDYKSLLKTMVNISVDGAKYDFVIQNIYLQQNYYYEGLNDVMGDFIIVSYYMPANLRDEQQNIYFMSEHDYQNKYFMEYINKAYSNKKYSVKVNHYNIKGNIDDDYLLSFYYGSKNGNWDWLSAIFTVLSGALLISSLFILAVNNKKIKFLGHITYALCLIIPYLVFYSLYIFTNNVIFLSRSSTRLYTILSIVFVVAYIAILLLKKQNIFKMISANKEGQSNEDVDI